MASSKPRASIVVLGAGVGGLELSLAMAHRLPNTSVKLIDPSRTLGNMSSGLHRRLKNEAEAAGIFRVRDSVIEIQSDHVVPTNGEQIPFDFLVSAVAVYDRNANVTRRPKSLDTPSE